MSSRDFRSLASPGEPGRPERLFRAAIHAFCCLPRPSRRELVQLDDLAVPLLPEVSPGARRFAAAALSECAYVPPQLVALLADDRPEIAAPLLIRSSALGDVALIALIGRHGLGHARIIARRKDLNPPIAQLIRALEAASRHQPGAAEPEHEVDRIRRELRAMMQEPATPPTLNTDADDAGAAIVAAALSGTFAALATALGAAISVDRDKAPLIIGQQSLADLPLALRAAGLSGERAFLVASCISPARFASVRDIRGFIEDYEALDTAECMAAVAEWRDAVDAAEPRLQPANTTSSEVAVRAS